MYSESKDGQVILTMSKEDYNFLLFALGCATGEKMKQGEKIDGMLSFMNRLNQDNPHLTPYQVDRQITRTCGGCGKTFEASASVVGPESARCPRCNPYQVEAKK